MNDFIYGGHVIPIIVFLKKVLRLQRSAVGGLHVLTSDDFRDLCEEVIEEMELVPIPDMPA